MGQDEIDDYYLDELIKKKEKIYKHTKDLMTQID